MNSNYAEQFMEVKMRAESYLSSAGSAQDVKDDIQVIASIPLPLSEKYRHIAAETMIKSNRRGNSRQETVESLNRLFKALSILEKYGCNLTSSAKPKYWRSVKHNNPVFRSTVDAIQGGREVLHLFGYTNRQVDGLSFPDDVVDPDVKKVAAVNLEVMTLRSELDMLIKGTHPHPEGFKNVVPFIAQQCDLASDAVVIPPGEHLTPSLAMPTQPKPALRKLSPALPAPASTGPGPHPLLTSPTTGLGTQSLVLPAPASATASPGFMTQSLNMPGPTSRAESAGNGLPLKTPTGDKCHCCGGVPSIFCVSCGNLSLCEQCDHLFHCNPARANHKRETIQQAKPEFCSICGVDVVYAHCPTCSQRLCSNCDAIYHSNPDRTSHTRSVVAAARPASSSLSPWRCSHCTTVNEVRAALCMTCERPRLSTAAFSIQSDPAPSFVNTEWQCKSCTVLNQGSSILCEACERPRLATRPPCVPELSPGPASKGSAEQWTCVHCTFVNQTAASVCEICVLPRESPPTVASLRHQPSEVPSKPRPKPKPRVLLDHTRQKQMADEGLKLIQQIREAEKRGVSPEEVYAALCVCGGSNVDPCDWLDSELPHVLDEICATAASIQESRDAEEREPAESVDRVGGTAEGRRADGQGEGVRLSRAEAKQAWLSARGNTEKAVRQLLRDRRAKMTELRSLGFREVTKCEEALRLSGGDVKGALSLLQRPLLEPFHQRIWSDQPETPFDTKNADKQRICRRLLALYQLPSWGRCELALSLLQEPDVTYSLEDVIQAVKESQDRDFIRRMLNNDCLCCLSTFPRSKMQSLTSCQCLVCHDCFRQHFTIAVRDMHIRDMVCPICRGPDINDPEQLDSHFCTLDIQLRNCLDREVYDLYHKKLTEHALMKDPKFLWCCHCSYGFIYDGDQLKVTCPNCKESFCAQCKKPWEPQHQDATCEQFQQWKKENDPEYQRLGLAAFLCDNGITCPHCRFLYALTKGGCMHFTCSQCRFQFCSGCNNPYYTMPCKTALCNSGGLHAHHPRDCLFYLRDWEPARLQALLQKHAVDFNTNPPDGTQTDACNVMEQNDEGQHTDSPCGIQTQPGQAGLCEKHYKEYLVSLINGHMLDPAELYDIRELSIACDRYRLDCQRGDNEEDNAYHARLLATLVKVPLGENVPRTK